MSRETVCQEEELPKLDKREVWLSNAFQAPPDITLEHLGNANYWGYMMQGALPDEELDEFLHLPKTRNFLFVGPWGTGRKTVAAATAGSLGKLNYRFACLTRTDFEGLKPAQVSDYLDGLFEQLTAEAPLCLIFDGVAQWDNRELVCQLLGDHLAVAAIEELPLFAMVIAKEPEEVGEHLLSQLTVCGFAAPTEEERSAFFQQELDEYIPLKVGTTFLDLAKESEGLNYYQLSQLIQLMRLMLKREAMANGSSLRTVREAFVAQTVRMDLPKFRKLVARVRLQKQEAVPRIQYVQASMPAAGEQNATIRYKPGVGYTAEQPRKGTAVGLAGVKTADTMSGFAAALKSYMTELEK